jgi:protein-S-isoprenylcysteine O-methyltransferase Ste14
MNGLIKIPPPVYALLTLALCKGVDRLLPLPVDVAAPVLGTVIALLGMALVFWAWWHFFKHKTTPIPTGEPSALVGGGPYRFTRNPMYLGLLIILASVALVTGSPFYFLSPAGFYLIVDRLFVPYEESKLERLFGIEFVNFKRDVKRWV